MINSMQMDDFPLIGEVLNSYLDKFITFAINYCVYIGYAHYIMFKWVHTFFLKAKYLLF